MSETPNEVEFPEYEEPAAPDPETELERPAYTDAGDGDLNPGPEPTPEEKAHNDAVLNAPVSDD